VSEFAGQNSREDGQYIQGTMTEVKSTFKVAEVTISELGQLKKGISACLRSRVSQGTEMYFLQELLCSSIPYICLSAKKPDFIRSTY